MGKCISMVTGRTEEVTVVAEAFTSEPEPVAIDAVITTPAVVTVR